MLELLVFGDVFYYRGEEYVFLAMNDGVIYAAQILDKQQSKQFVGMRNQSIRKDGEKRTNEKIIYCFVELKTGQYAQRIAHLNKSDEQKEPAAILHASGDSISKEDMLEMRDAILRGPVPAVLSRLVGELSFEDIA